MIVLGTDNVTKNTIVTTEHFSNNSNANPRIVLIICIQMYP